MNHKRGKRRRNCKTPPGWSKADPRQLRADDQGSGRRGHPRRPKGIYAVLTPSERHFAAQPQLWFETFRARPSFLLRREPDAYNYQRWLYEHREAAS